MEEEVESSFSEAAAYLEPGFGGEVWRLNESRETEMKGGKG